MRLGARRGLRQNFSSVPEGPGCYTKITRTLGALEKVGIISPGAVQRPSGDSAGRGATKAPSTEALAPGGVNGLHCAGAFHTHRRRCPQTAAGPRRVR